MIRVRIATMVIGFFTTPSVLSLCPLGEESPSRELPVCIGTAEAASIAAALEKRTTPRPLTHELLADSIRAMGGKVSRVCIDKVEGDLFYATIYVAMQDGQVVTIDARPSDAIAMSIYAHADIYVEEDVFEAASVPSSFKPGGDSKVEMEEFHKFIENVNPEDFVFENPNGNN